MGQKDQSPLMETLSSWPQTSPESYPTVGNMYTLIHPALKDQCAMVGKEGSPAGGRGAASGSIAIQGRAGSRGIVERARSLESDRAGLILTPPLLAL